MKTKRTLEQVIGAELKRLRPRGLRQEVVAQAAQSLGLNWTQATVAAIESGRRGISLVEAASLPWIALNAGFGARSWALGDFIPDEDEVVVLAPSRKEVTLRAIRPQYAELGATTERDRGEMRPDASAPAGTVPPPPGGFVTEADRRAARKLRVKPEAIAVAAKRLWGHSLDEERDDRIGNIEATPQERGRVTRLLVQDLKRKLKRRGGG